MKRILKTAGVLLAIILNAIVFADSRVLVPKVDKAAVKAEQAAQTATQPRQNEIKAEWNWLTMTQADLLQHAIPVLRANVDLCGDQVIIYLGERICDFFPLYLSGESTPNAFTDGLYVYITAGMVRNLHSADEYRAVIGHEIGHILANHIKRKMRNRKIGQAVATILSLASIDAEGLIKAAGDIGYQSFSKKHELEADYIGAYMLARANGDVNAAKQMWRRWGEGKRKTWGSSHPSDAKRFVVLAATAVEISDKRNAGEELLPNFKEKR